MKRILILLLIQILPTYCLATTTNNDSFKMSVIAISLNNQISKNYSIFDEIKNNRLINQSVDINFFVSYYPEVQKILESELEKENYNINKNIKKHNQPYIRLNYAMKREENLFYKGIAIEACNPNGSPLWQVALGAFDDISDLRIYIPSMIKCAGKYFNKNFRGVVTCKR